MEKVLPAVALAQGGLITSTEHADLGRHGHNSGRPARHLQRSQVPGTGSSLVVGVGSGYLDSDSGICPDTKLPGDRGACPGVSGSVRRDDGPNVGVGDSTLKAAHPEAQPPALP